MLTRLKLTAIRDQLDSLLDEAARRELTLRETARAAVRGGSRAQGRAAHPDGAAIAKFPFVRTLDGFDFAAQPSLDREAGPRARHLPLGGQRRCAAAARAARRRQDASGGGARPRGDPPGYSVLFVPATALVTTLAKAHTKGGSRSGWCTTPSRSC